MSDQSDKAEHIQAVEVPIEWYVPDSIISRYATNMVVQHTGQEFIISFFDTKPPIIIGQPTKEILDGLKSVRAECIARVIVSPTRMSQFIEVLQTNLARAVSKTEES